MAQQQAGMVLNGLFPQKNAIETAACLAEAPGPAQPRLGPSALPGPPSPQGSAARSPFATPR